jgi:hypothetical protein
MMILREKTKAQSTLEFTFGMIVIVFLVYGMVQIFRWAGMDLVQRRWLQDTTIVVVDSSGDPGSELYANMDSAMPMAAVYHGNITNGS